MEVVISLNNIPSSYEELKDQLKSAKLQISKIESFMERAIITLNNMMNSHGGLYDELQLAKLQIVELNNIIDSIQLKSSPKILNDLQTLKTILLNKEYSLLLEYDVFSAKTLVMCYESGGKINYSSSYGSIKEILMIKDKKIINHILGRIDDIEFEDEFGWKLIHNIIEFVDLDSMKILVARGINLYPITRPGNIPYNQICATSSYSMVKYMLSIMDKTKVHAEDMKRKLEHNDKLSRSEKEELKKLI